MVVVQVLRQQPLLQPLKLRHLVLLPLDVALVLHGDLHLFHHVRRQFLWRGIEGSQIVIAYLRSPQQVDKAAPVVDGGSAPLHQQSVQRLAAGNARVLQPPDLLRHSGVFGLHLRQTLLTDQTDPVADGRQPLVGVVLPQHQPVLRAAGHHPVRLLRTLCHQIVDEGADVALTAF